MDAENYTHNEKVRVWTGDAGTGVGAYGLVDRQIEKIADRTMPEGKVHVRIREVDFLTGGFRYKTRLVETRRIEKGVRF